MDIDRLLKKVKELRLPSGEYAVFGSAVLAVRGLREAPNIDLIVSDRLWQKLLDERQPDEEGFIRYGVVKISNWWFAPTRKDIPTMIAEAEEIEGLPFARIEEVLAYKKDLSREKDKNDVEIIEKYLSNRTKGELVGLGVSTYERLLDRFVGEVRVRLMKEVMSVILFGSVARGKANGDSDIDLFVLYDDGLVGRKEISDRLTEIVVSLRVSKEYSELVAKGVWPEIYPFLISKGRIGDTLWVCLDSIEEGKIIFDKDGFGRSFLDGLRKKVDFLGGRRVELSDGGWLWILFSDYKKCLQNINF